MSQVWGALRWVIAAVVLALVVVVAARGVVAAVSSSVSYQTGVDEASESAVPEPSQAPDSVTSETVPLSAGQAVPVADSSIAAATVQQETQPLLAIGPGVDDGALLAFPGIDGSAACLQEVLLSFEVVETAMPTELGAFISAAALAPGTADGTPLTAALAGDGSPAAKAAVLEAGPQVIDVTGAFQTGGDAGALTFALVPTELAASDGRLIEIASAESETPATLTWTLADTCA